MKTDLATAILAAIVGVAVSYFVVNGLLLKDPNSVVVKNIETIKASVDEPNPEVFNYRAINPTVETYIDCTNYDLSGNCLEKEQQGNQ
ncbi:hypothetical protein IJG27_03095 [Candidatus Saccharibacteria bacterium]|nr:hypothetical protein [Candidatus Saccharibacteria bacterium]